MNNLYPNTNYGYQSPFDPYDNSFSNRPQVTWVNGFNEASSFHLPPDSSIILMENTAQRFYLKATDKNGMPMIRAFSFEEIMMNQSPNISADYVSKEEFDALKNDFNSLLSKLGEGEQNA